MMEMAAQKMAQKMRLEGKSRKSKGEGGRQKIQLYSPPRTKASKIADRVGWVQYAG
jgi:hypothetical protein